MLRTIQRRLSVGVCCSLLYGCIVPFPHRVPSLPETAGLLLREGNGVPDVAVWRTAEMSSDPCSKSSGTVTSTNSAGEFFLPGEWSWQFFVLILPVPADSLTEWTTCFATASARFGWRSNS